MQDQDDLYLYRSKHKEQKAVNQPKYVTRKFLVKELPESIKGQLIHRITNVYFTTGTSEIKFVKRQIIDVDSISFFVDENYVSVRKQGYGKLRTYEEESLSKEDFELMSNSKLAKTIFKDRCFARTDSNDIISIDIYSGNLQGLCIAKVKFETISDADRFVKPDWLGVEVTGFKDYYEYNLAITQKLPQNLAALERV